MGHPWRVSNTPHPPPFSDVPHSPLVLIVLFCLGLSPGGVIQTLLPWDLRGENFILRSDHLGETGMV